MLTIYDTNIVFSSSLIFVVKILFYVTLQSDFATMWFSGSKVDSIYDKIYVFSPVNRWDICSIYHKHNKAMPRTFGLIEQNAAKLHILIQLVQGCSTYIVDKLMSLYTRFCQISEQHDNSNIKVHSFKASQDQGPDSV